MIYKYAQFFGLLFIMVCVGFIALYLGQDLNWDLQSYHYYNGYAFFYLSLKQDFLAANLQSYFNPYLDAMSYVFITYLSPKAAIFLLGFIQGCNFYLLAVMANILAPASLTAGQRSWVIAAIVLLGLLSATVIGEIGTTFNDLTVVIVLMLALVLILKALQLDLAGRKKWLLILTAGICLGIAAALKLTMSIYVITAILAITAINQSWVDKLKIMILLAAGTWLGFLLLNGCWLYEVWRQFGNPVFPLYNKIFKSPDYFLINPKSIEYYPKNLAQALFFPFYFSWQHLLTAEAPFRDFRLVVVYLLLMIYAVKVIFTKKFAMTGLQKYLLTFFILSYVLWEFTFSNQRYAITLDVLAPLLIYILLENIFDKLIWVNGMGLLIFIFLLITLKPIHLGKVHWASGSYFDVQIPPAVNLQQPSVVFLYYPAAFIRPFFPGDWHFIGLNGSAKEWPFLAKFLQENVPYANKYPWYVLFPWKFNPDMMQQYRFKLAKPCWEIKTRPSVLYFCEIEHKSL